MKKHYFINLILICIVTLSLLAFTKAICDDDTLLNAPPHAGYPYYNELLKISLAQTGVLFEYHDDTLSLQQIILYLERQEKSPPLIMPAAIL